MSEIQEIQRQIAELDKQINNLIAEHRLPPIKPAKPFPLGTWILALLVAAWWLFGDMVPMVGSYRQMTTPYDWYATLILGALALLRTVLWLLGRPRKTPPEYLEVTRKVQELQEQRRLLQKELREAQKRA
ncbi:MAG: hypothetical protein N2644_06720 [Candidatus Sumerlaea chitinivorans]|nr:hypothetical protein [Candidatus Sumerlaea chitinivorans]